MKTAYLRSYIQKKEENIKNKNFKTKKNIEDTNPLFVFDTETTIDEKQNLNVGSYGIFDPIENVLIEQGFFYKKKYVSEAELKVLEAFCKETKKPLMEHAVFITKKFYDSVLFKRATCTGFNLPFDISRIAIDCSFTKGERFHGGFSFTLAPEKSYPRVKVKADGKKFALIGFGSSPINKDEYFYAGKWLDLHTLALALSGRRTISLEKACEIFQAKIKKSKAKEHGKITKEYLEYLSNDVFATYELHNALLRNLKNYGVSKEPHKIFSQASLGKAILTKMGISNFQTKNPAFSPKLLGLVMNTYYGGRSEVACRKEPMQVSLLDVTSMYPTVNILLELNKHLIAEKIDVEECTKEIQELLNDVTLEDLRNPEYWTKFVVVATLKPKNDILPIRGCFDPKKQYQNIGLCEIESDKEIAYGLPDLIASKLLSGKTPKIEKAYCFVPKGQQKTLQEINILGLKIDPRKENIFRVLVEERQRIKKKLKTIEPDNPEYFTLENQERVLKLLSNSTSYGIFIELNPEHRTSDVKVFGNNEFESVGQYEAAGTFFNPIMGTIIPSAARLFLAIIETILARMNKKHAFCDTDSMAVPPETVTTIKDFFKPLSPYSEGIELLKEEESNVWFYGISAKRYVLYQIKNNDFEIVKYSLHGLGHLRNPFGELESDWHKEIWKIILNLHYKRMKEEDLHLQFGNLKAVMQLTTSNQDLWKRVKGVNNSKGYDDQIKPFGFVSVGFPIQSRNGKVIRPIAPYNSDTQAVARGWFINAETGEKMKGIEYWKPLSDVIIEYMNHPEAKLEGDTGFLKRQRVHITQLVQIGKEAKN